MSAKTIIGLLLTAVTLSLVPLAIIARSRASKSPRTALHMFFDMDKQQRFDPQSKNAMFADGRAMRPQMEGTLAQEDLKFAKETLTVSDGQPRPVGGNGEPLAITSPEQYAAVMYGRVRAAGMTDEQFNAATPPEKPNEAGQTFYLSAFPQGIEVNRDFLARGQERFNIYCAPCHGATGYGDGMVHRATLRLQTTKVDAVAMWVAPSNLTDDDRRGRPVGHLFNTITNGIRNMPAYDKQISVQDRWAIVAYVRALQRSQGGAAAATQPK
jgi:mono/diheme cytochrome c family protein